MKSLKKVSVLLMFVAVAFLLGGCAETKQARSVEPTGFLVDYSILQKGEKDEALLVYRNPDAEINRYSKVLLDSVMMGRPEDATEKQLEDLQKLANNWYVYSVRELQKDYSVVKAPEPGTMRIQAAIADPAKSVVAGDFLSSVVPVGIAASVAKDFATGKPLAVGEITMEIKVTDATTGELLGAMVDKRVGGKSFTGKCDSWSHANAALEYWAKRLRYALCMERGGIACEKP